MRDLQVQSSTCRKKPKTCLFFERGGALWIRNAMSQKQCPYVWIMFGLSTPSDLSATGFASGPCPLEQRRKKDVHSFTHTITQWPPGSEGHFCLWHVHLLSVGLHAFNREEFLHRYVFFSIAVFHLYYPRLHLVTGEMVTSMLVVIMLQDIVVC